MTEIVWYMATHSYWGQDRPWQLQTLHAEAFPLVLVTVHKSCSASDLATRVSPATCDPEFLEAYDLDTSLGICFCCPIRPIMPALNVTYKY